MANKKFFSTKTYRQIGPVAYRQWRADSHCNLIHGYAMSFHFEFEADTLDARNWVTDFGGLRPLKDDYEYIAFNRDFKGSERTRLLGMEAFYSKLR